VVGVATMVVGTIVVVIMFNKGSSIKGSIETM